MLSSGKMFGLSENFLVCRKNFWFVGKNFRFVGKVLPLAPPKKHGTHSATVFNKYKTFSVLIYSYINTSGNWENDFFRLVDDVDWKFATEFCENYSINKCNFPSIFTRACPPVSQSVFFPWHHFPE
jgi:hypothetical protein